MTGFGLEPAAATELGDLLQLLHDWLAADQNARAGLDAFAGAAFTSQRLRTDLIRFAYLLGHFDQSQT